VRVRLLGLTVNLRDPGVHFIGEVQVVARRGASLMNGEAGQFGRLLDRRFTARLDIPEHADDFPNIRTPWKSRASTTGTRPKDNAWMCIHPETLVDKACGQA